MKLLLTRRTSGCGCVLLQDENRIYRGIEQCDKHKQEIEELQRKVDPDGVLKNVR